MLNRVAEHPKVDKQKLTILARAMNFDRFILIRPTFFSLNKSQPLPFPLKPLLMVPGSH